MKRVRVGHERVDGTRSPFLSVGSEKVKLSPEEAVSLGQALQNEGILAKLDLRKADKDG